MKLFATALLVVCCVGAALARPEDTSAAAAAAAELVAMVEHPEQQPGAPEAQSDLIVQLISKMLAKARQIIKAVPGAHTYMTSNKKEILAKLDEYRAQLVARDEATIVPDSPEEARANALALKAAIAKVLEEVDGMRAELVEMN